MALNDDLHAVGLAIESAATHSAKNGYISDHMAKIWDCGTVSYAWPAGAHEPEVYAKVTVAVSQYQTEPARLAAARPVRVEFLAQAYRINPRASSEPIRASTFDLMADEAPDQHRLEEAFEQASKLAGQLAVSLGAAGQGPGSDGEAAGADSPGRDQSTRLPWLRP